MPLDLWRKAIPPEHTKAEADFLVKALQCPKGLHLLDVPCVERPDEDQLDERREDAAHEKPEQRAEQEPQQDRVHAVDWNRPHRHEPATAGGIACDGSLELPAHEHLSGGTHREARGGGGRSGPVELLQLRVEQHDG